MPRGDHRSFAAIAALEDRIKAIDKLLEDHEEWLELHDERLDSHEADIADAKDRELARISRSRRRRRSG